MCINEVVMTAMKFTELVVLIAYIECEALLKFNTSNANTKSIGTLLRLIQL